MPAQVVIVHPDSVACKDLAEAIRANGHTVQPFVSPMLALAALEQATQVELLITCVQFNPGMPNGKALAMMTLRKRPGLKLLFLTGPGEAEHVADLGECLPLSSGPVAVANTAERLFG